MPRSAMAQSAESRPSAIQAATHNSISERRRPDPADTVRPDKPEPRLILRTHTPSGAHAGDTIRYTIQLANPDDQPATDIAVTFDLPAGAVLVSATRDGREANGRVVWPNIESLGPGRLISYSFEITTPGTVASPEPLDMSPTGTNAIRPVDQTSGRSRPGDPGPRRPDPVRLTETGNFQGTARVSQLETGRTFAESVVETTPTPIPAASAVQAAQPPDFAADLEITKSGPASVFSFNTIVYQISFRNLGPNEATQVVVSDQLPAGVQFISASNGGTETGGVVTWPAQSALSFDTRAYEVTVRAPACPATLVNTATISSATADPAPANNSSTVTTEVTGPTCGEADMVVTKAGPVSAFTRDTVVYSIEATNRGPAAATDVVVSDQLPAGVTFVDATGGVVPVGGQLTWPVGGLASGSSVDFTVRVVAPACPAVVTNTARVTSSNDSGPANNAASVATTVLGQGCVADVKIDKVGPPLTSPGATFSYTLEVTNNGPLTALDVVVVDTLPVGLEFESASGSPTPTPSKSGLILTWPSRVLEVDKSLTYRVTVTVPSSSTEETFTNVARVLSTSPVDPDSSNNRASVTTTVFRLPDPDLAVEKDTVGGFLPGRIGLYRLKVRNLGPGPTVDTIFLTDTLPAGVTLQSATGSGWTFEPGGSGVIRGNFPGILLAGDSTLVQVSVVIADTATGKLCNVVHVETARDTVKVSNNWAEACVTLPGPDLAVEKEAIGPFLEGRTGRYRITVRNVGLGPAISPILMTDSLPAGLEFQSATAPGWTLSATGSVVTGQFAGPLLAGATTTLELVVNVIAASGELCNVVRVTTAGDTLNVGNNRAETCVVVPPPPHIDLQKAADRSEVEVGGLVAYELLAVVTGPVPLQAVSIVDRLPAGFTYLAGSARVDGRAVADPTNGAVRTLVFELGTIVPTDTVTVTYIARAGPGAVGGDGINRAQAFYQGGASDESRARVRVVPGVFSDEGMIVGTVFADSLGTQEVVGECRCEESDGIQRGEAGIPGVRVLLQDGTSAITDEQGRYLFPALSPRTWVVKIDRSTLPPGSGLIRLSNRHSEDGATVLVDLKKGELHRADFAAGWIGREMPETRREIEQRRLAVVAMDAASSRTALTPPGRRTGLAPGIPWTRYVPLLPRAEAVPAIPGDGSFPAITGFPRTQARSTAQSDTAATGSPGATTTEPGTESRSADAGPGLAHQFADSAAGQIAIGLIEARLDLRSLSDTEIGGVGRDAFEDALLSVSFDDDDGKVQGGTRAALFYHGRTPGRYGLTLRLDSEKDERAVLFRDIRPEDFYPIYGDGSTTGFDGRSRGRVYARIDAKDSYLTWGDFNTGRAPVGTAGTRSLGEYARTLNGALQHYESDRIAFDAFASNDRSVQVVDVMRAEGVSGPYPLTRTDGLVNSERVELVTRHRDQPSVVVRTEVLERFVDYTIEPLAGRILFRRPIPGFDEDLNPVEIRVTYEVEGDGDRFWVYGANARFRPLSGLEIGGGLVRDDNPVARLDLATVNATVELPASTFLTGEFARTEAGGSITGDATRLELLHSSDRVQLRGFWLSTDSAFRNPTSGYGSGRSELGLTGIARVAPDTHLFTEILVSEDNRTETRRDGGRIGLDRAFGEWLNAQVGFRYASSSVTRQAGAGQALGETKAVGARLSARLPGSRPGSVFAEFEQDVVEADQRRAAVGADYRVFDNIRLYARHEFINSLTGPWRLDPAFDRNATVFGVATDNRSGQAMFSEYRVRDAIDGREAQAAIGLRNSWRVNRGVRLSASFERLTPIGPGSTNATAITGAAEFTGSPSWKGSIRTEYQARDGADNVFGSIGYARRLGPEFSLLGSSVFSTLIDGGRASARSRLGIAYRDVSDNRWNALARYENRYERAPDAALGGTRSETSHILAAHADFQPIAGALLRGQWTSRFTSERWAGQSTSGSAHLLGGRGTLDLCHRVDVGVIGRTLFSGGQGSTRFGFGGEVGVRLPADLRLAVGYNVFGFREDVASQDEYTDRGAYIQLAFRFDEGLWSSDRTTVRPGTRCDSPRPVKPVPPPADSLDLSLFIRYRSSVLSGDTFPVELHTRNRRLAPADTLVADSIALTASLPGRGTLDPLRRGQVPGDSITAALPSGTLRRGAPDTVNTVWVVAPTLSSGAQPDSIMVLARVATRPGETDTTNNHTSALIRVLPKKIDACNPDREVCDLRGRADLTVWIDGPSRSAAHDSIEYVIWTKNLNDGSPNRVAAETDSLRVWYPSVSISAGTGEETWDLQFVRLALPGPIQPGDSVPWNLRLHGPGRPAGLFVNALAWTNTPESDYSNNWATHRHCAACWDAPPPSPPPPPLPPPMVGLWVDGPPSAVMLDTVRYVISTAGIGDSAVPEVTLSGEVDDSIPVVRVSGGADGIGWLIPRLEVGAIRVDTVDVICGLNQFALDVLMITPDGEAQTRRRSTECLRSDLRTAVDLKTPGPLRPGDIVTYAITTTNDGPAPARRVRTAVTLPGGAAFVPGGGRVDTLAVADTLPVGVPVTHSLDVRLPRVVGDVRVSAYASTSTPESDSTNNSASHATPLPWPPDSTDPTDLAIQIDTVSVRGHTVTYRVTTTNLSVVDASTVVVQVNWPDRVRFVRASRAAMYRNSSGDPVRAVVARERVPITLGRSTVTWPAIDVLRAGESIEEQVVLVMPAAPDAVVIEATAGTATAEVTLANNTGRTTAAMIQEVIITDTVFIGRTVVVQDTLFVRGTVVIQDTLLVRGTVVIQDTLNLTPVPPGPWNRLLWPLLILLLVLLALAIVLLIIRIITRWPPPPPVNHVVPPVPPIPPVPPPTPFVRVVPPFFVPPVPWIPGLPAACGPIEVDGTRGTAYLVRTDRLVTCSHVVSNRNRGERVSIRLGDRMIWATIRAVDPHIDIAILEPTEPIRDITPLELAPEGPAPAYWHGFGYPGGPDVPGFEFGGVTMQPSATDRFDFRTMTITGPGLADLLLDPSCGLRGSPIMVAGKVIGHMRGHVPHPDTLKRSFAGLLKAVPASRILELLNEPAPASEATSSPRPPGSDQAAPPQEWSIAPDLDCCDDGSHHAAIVFRSADAPIAKRLAGRLEGDGFKVALRQQDGPVNLAADSVGVCRTLLLHSRAWPDESMTAAAATSSVESGRRPIIVRTDNGPLPESLKSMESIDFCGKEPDTGPAYRELQHRLMGEQDPTRTPLIEAAIEATESAIEIVRSARGWPKRTRFAVKRWLETGLPGHALALIGAEQLLETGHVEDALEILEQLPDGVRTSQLMSRALAAVGRVDDAIEKLESLRTDGQIDSETSAPLAELYHRKWNETGGHRVAWLEKAFEVSSELYRRTGNAAAGMDAARAALSADDIDEARILASEVRDTLTGREDYDNGDYGTLGEASLLLGDIEAALGAFERAVAAAPGAIESISSLYRRVRTIVDKVSAVDPVSDETAAALERIFALPGVVAVQPDAGAAFESVPGLQAELEQLFARNDIGLAVCCPDSLPALVVAEEVLHRGGSMQAILPVPRELFLSLRIASAYTQRVNAVLDHARTEVSLASTGSDLDQALVEARKGRNANDRNLHVAIQNAAETAARARVQKPIAFGAPAGPTSGRDPVVAGATEAVAFSPPAAEARMRDIGGVRLEVPESAEPGNYANLHCVAIGIDEYTHWPTLHNAVNDARGVAKMLETQFGFSTRHLINSEATRDRICALMEETLPREVGKDDLLVLIFAGHGHTERKDDDEEHGFLVPVDADRDDVDDLLRMEQVVSWAEKVPCEHVLYIFDSCFSGSAAFAGGVTVRGDSDDARVAISAGTAEQTVFDGLAPAGYEDHSVFTAHLLLRLTAAVKAAAEEDQVDSMRIYVDLRDKVTRATSRRQTPVYGILPGHGAGEIWLTVRKSSDT